MPTDQDTSPGTGESPTVAASPPFGSSPPPPPPRKPVRSEELVVSSGAAAEPAPRASSRRGRVGQHFRVAIRSLGEMLDVGLLVLGTAIVALGVTVLLDGFSVVDLGLTDSAGAMLGSGIVLGVLGAFALGVAAEGPIGHPARRDAGDPLERATGRAISLVLVGLGMLALSAFLEPLVSGLPTPFQVGVELLGVIGLAGCTVAVVIGVPLLFLLERATTLPRWVADWRGGSLFLVWAIGAAVLS
jgi:hypothetical protein